MTSPSTEPNHGASPRAPDAPGPRHGGLLGALSAYKADILGFYLRNLVQYGDVFRFRLGPVWLYCVSNPQDIRRVFLDNHENYGRQAYRTLFRIMGNGMITSEGPFWRRQRRIAAPLFTPRQIAGFSVVMQQACEQMLGRWDSVAAQGGSFDLSREMIRLTLQIISQTMFSRDLSADADHVGDAIEEIQHYADRLSTSPMPLPTWVPTPANRRFNRALRAIDRLLAEVIQERRAQPAAHDDLLARLMNARDEESGEGMDDRQVRDEVITMFLAGHESTSNALIWCFYLLAQHTGVARRLREEILAVAGDGPVTPDHLAAMPYLGMVLNESLRLYPPVWIIARSVKQDDVLGGYHIPKGSFVVAAPYVSHHHPGLWENPEGFDPERFSPEREKAIPKLAFYPFGGGQRLCIGNNFSMMEMKLILAHVLRRFRLDLVPGHPVVPEPIITLRAKHGMWMRPVVSDRAAATVRPAAEQSAPSSQDLAEPDVAGCPFHPAA